MQKLMPKRVEKTFQGFKVNLSQTSYPLYITTFGLEKSLARLKKQLYEKKLYVITNHTVKGLYKDLIDCALKKTGISPVWVSIPDGEKHKNLATCEKIFTKLSQKAAHRKSALLALGGGVVGDITGFVAASYMRGIDYFQMPTTLLAQVDASIGGKTGVDITTGKNMVGAFYQPKAVFIHTRFIKTLPKKELQCGMAEVIKYGVIRDASLFDFVGRCQKSIFNCDQKTLAQVIHKCCAIKAGIVQEDERELSLRAILNFGHTLGHAIEVLSSYKNISHGEAVAIGMVFAASLSRELGLCLDNDILKITRILQLFGLPIRIPEYRVRDYIKAMFRDKKTEQHIIRFILLEKIGRVTITPLHKDVIKKCLNNVLREQKVITRIKRKTLRGRTPCKN
ncbi:MAG: 3-dehydroquinate synthase [Deltaproteobacteria bacterium]|nr:3-dehydroquinate synthase [Deltaproteobacteria bacterium]